MLLLSLLCDSKRFSYSVVTVFCFWVGCFSGHAIANTNANANLPKIESATVISPDISSPDLAGVARTMLVVSTEIPMIDMQFKMDVGSARDPIGKEGLAQLTASLIETATSRLTQDQIQDQVVDLALQWSSNVDVDAATFSLRYLSKPDIASAAVALWLDTLTDAVFSKTSFDREKQRMLESLKRLDKNPGYRQNQALMANLYPNSVYSRFVSNTSIAAISLDDVRAFYQTYYPKSYRSLAAVGDINGQTLVDRIKLPKSWQTELQAKYKLFEFDSSLASSAVDLRQNLAISQAHVGIVVAVPSRQHKDIAALLVANHWLGGGGFGSKITDVIREKNGLAYSAGSDYQPFYDRGVWRFSLQTTSSQAQEALGFLGRVLDDAVSLGVSDVDLNRVKQELINGFALKVDNNQKRLAWLSTLSYYDLPFDYLSGWRDRIAGVSGDAVNQVLRNYLANNRRITSVITATQK